MADTATTYSGHIFSVGRRLWRFYESNTNNSYGYQIYTVLFPAAMQGDQTEQSIIHALDRINRHEELFDGVVIIRGGGATSDLNSFDSYPLAVNVAQFPLPVITGIGHERDDTVIDMVANTRVKPLRRQPNGLSLVCTKPTHMPSICRTRSAQKSVIESTGKADDTTRDLRTSTVHRTADTRRKHKTGLLTQQIKLALRTVIDSERNKLDHTEKLSGYCLPSHYSNEDTA